MPNRRSTLLVALATLALIQLAHLLDVLRYADDATFPSVLADPLAIAGITAATVAIVAVARRWRHAHDVAITAGGTVAVGFTLYHGIPIDLGVNNPYWGPDGHADLIRWLTVLAAIAAGLWSALLAARTSPRHSLIATRPPRPEASTVTNR